MSLNLKPKLGKLFIFTSLLLTLVFAVSSAEFDKIIEDSDQAIKDTEFKINKSNQKIQQTEDQGKFTPDGGNGSSEPPTFTNETSDGKIYDNGKDKFASINKKLALQSTDNNDNIAYIEYQIDDSPFQKYTTPIKFNTGGVHYLIYRAVDYVGNKEPYNIYKIIIDDAPPDVIILPSKKLFIKAYVRYATPDYEFELTAKDSQSGVKKIQYSIDGGVVNDYTGKIKVATHGTHKLTHTAVDNVGNVSAPGNFEWVVDAKKPIVKIKSEPPMKENNGKKFGSSKTQFYIESKDEGSGVNQVFVSVDGGEYKIYTSPLSFSDSKEYIIKAKCTDNVDHESEVVTLQFSIDSSAPKTQLSVE